MKDNEEMENIFEDIDEDITYDDIEPEVDSPTSNNSYNSNANLKNNFFKNNDKTTSQRLQNSKKNNNLNSTSSAASNAGREVGNKINGKSEEEKGAIEKGIDDVAGKVGSAAVTAATGGAVSGPAADFLGEVAAQTVKKEIKKKITIAIIIASFVFIMFVIFITILSNTEDDESETNTETKGYITSNISEDELISYLIYLNYCEDEKSCKDTNSYKYYQTFKDRYELYQGGCGKLDDYYLRNGGLPCDISIYPELIMETLSYDLTDREFFWTLSFGGTKVEFEDLDKIAISTTVKDIDDLALAMSEYVHDRCHTLETEISCYIEKTVQGGGSNQAPTQKKSVPCDTPGAIQETKTIKKPQDLFYFQISFDKYVSFLKYGWTSSHPNISAKWPVMLGDGTYVDRVCGDPSNDQFVDNKSLTTNSSNNNTNNQNVPEPTVTGSGLGVDIANYALQFLGNPYVYGGNSLTNGIDCSGFVQQIYAKFGISLPRTSGAQANSGIEVSFSEAQPGDLIYYPADPNKGYDSPHIAIYLGNNQIVHASSRKTGIKVSNNASYRTIGTVRRVA